jgi:hypothetical protein
MNWQVHLDRDQEHEEEDHRYSITLDEKYGGWRTDSGYEGYGLPKGLAQWICETLNKNGKDCPYEMICGYWTKKEGK